MSFRDPSLSKIVPIEDHPFGKWKSGNQLAGLLKNRLHITVGGDNSVFWISDRRGHVIQMDREELIELLTLLNRRMPLDALGSI